MPHCGSLLAMQAIHDAQRGASFSTHCMHCGPRMQAWNVCSRLGGSTHAARQHTRTADLCREAIRTFKLRVAQIQLDQASNPGLP